MSLSAFAALLDRLACTPHTPGKERLLAVAFGQIPDPQRGLMLAALTGDLKLRQVTPGLLRGLAETRTDARLFAASHAFVGDLAETVALIWPEGGRSDPPFSNVAAELSTTARAQLPAVIAARLDSLGPSERHAFPKLATGALRVGVTASLARATFAAWAGLPLTEVEAIWHALTPPYLDLFAWAAGGPRPKAAARAPFRPVMLSTPTDLAALAMLNPADFAAEWKWDGLRIQAVSEGGIRRLYSRTGEDISAAFPDVIDLMTFDGTLDGELLVRRGGEIAGFGELQQRLNRKTVSPALLRSHPVGLRLYDVLVWNGRDLHDLSHDARRAVLAQAVAALDPRIDLSQELSFATWDELAALRSHPPSSGIDGVMIKHRASRYLAGRVKGAWFKWKREPHLVDAVLMYAQPGQGRRSVYFSDVTFGLWNGDALVSVGRAGLDLSDAEMAEFDRFVRAHTVERFGAVRSIARTRVVEVAFEGLDRSSRHKSGVILRSPRIIRICDDKPASDADRLSTLQAMPGQVRSAG